VLNEQRWTEGIDATVTTIDWQALNQHPDLSFGLTNLAYVERMLEAGRYPLVDHTCLYQGRVLVDDPGAVAAFRDRHRGTRFPNIVPDYLRQTEWRVSSRLNRELSTQTPTPTQSLLKRAKSAARRPAKPVTSPAMTAIPTAV
jgi:hypothetical protein